MVILITIVHVIVCVFLAVVVLLQSGKAADLSAAFGGQGSQTVFGARGSATVLSKATTVAAALFMVTSLSLSVLATRTGTSSPAIFQKTVPLTPGSAPGALPATGGTVPIQVTPFVNGKQQEKQTINVPVPENKAPENKTPDKPAEQAPAKK